MPRKSLFLILATLFTIGPSASAKAPRAKPTPTFRPAPTIRTERYRIPDPEGEQAAVIMDFASAISGTDGTPQGIGRKVSGRSAKKNDVRDKDEETVLGF